MHKIPYVALALCCLFDNTANARTLTKKEKTCITNIFTLEGNLKESDDKSPLLYRTHLCLKDHQTWTSPLTNTQYLRQAILKQCKTPGFLCSYPQAGQVCLATAQIADNVKDEGHYIKVLETFKNAECVQIYEKNKANLHTLTQEEQKYVSAIPSLMQKPFSVLSSLFHHLRAMKNQGHTDYLKTKTDEFGGSVATAAITAGAATIAAAQLAGQTAIAAAQTLGNEAMQAVNEGRSSERRR